jgi:hypothetical protein
VPEEQINPPTEVLPAPPTEEKPKERRNYGPLYDKAVEGTLPKRGPGNPLLRKGEAPYNHPRLSPAKRLGLMERWIEDHPEYKPKNPGISYIVRKFLKEFPKTSAKSQRLIYIMEALYRTACNPRSKLQVAAAEALLKRAYGNTSASPEDREAIKRGGLTVVYVDRKAIDPEIPLALPEGPAQEPEFIEGQFEEEDDE